MMTMLRLPVLLFVVLGLVAACETTIDPNTGETTTLFAIPGTAANEEVFLERWRRCTEFASQSLCERRLGRRPQRMAGTSASGDYQPPQPGGHP